MLLPVIYSGITQNRMMQLMHLAQIQENGEAGLDEIFIS